MKKRKIHSDKMSSYIGTAGAAFIPQVYRNTRTATRKRRAAPQLPSKVMTQVMSYVPDQCPYITDNAERCGASFKYRNQLNQQPMDCSHYCIQNVGVWLSSLLQDLAQKEYVSFVVPLPSGVAGTSLDREYDTEYILHPIRFFASTSAPREPTSSAKGNSTITGFIEIFCKHPMI